MKNGKLLIAACCAALVATPASAAWYIKFDGVEGESLVTSMGFKGGVRVATGDVTGDGSADASGDGAVDAADYTVWRDNLGTGAAANGGPHVKVFDGSTGSAAPAKPLPRPKSGNVTLKRGVIDSTDQGAAGATTSYGPVITIKPKGDETGGPGDIKAQGDDQSTALLLPAVQKVREAAARMNAGDPCKVGPVRGPVKFRDSSNGKTARILDANVVSCEHETVTFTFSKIEWD